MISQPGGFVSPAGPDGFVARYGLVKYTPVLGRKYPREGVCEVCGLLLAGKPFLLFDHCHVHGWTRGLVCNWCNDDLGFLENGQTSRPAFMPRFVPRLEAYRLNCPECSPHRCPVKGWCQTCQDWKGAKR